MTNLAESVDNKHAITVITKVVLEFHNEKSTVCNEY